MKLYYPITIDLYKVSPLQVMEAQQGNVGRGAIVTLTAGSAVIDLTDETVEVYAKKPDGTVSWLECSVEEGKIKIDFTNQMLMSPGMLQVELRLKNEADDITTPIFMVKVNKSNVQSAGRSENELPLLDQIKKDVAAAQDEVNKLSEDKANRIVETASGEIIVVTDSAEAKPLGLAIDGKSEQNQYSGKNLVDITVSSTSVNGIEITNNGDGSFDAVGTSTKDTAIVLCKKETYEDYILEGGDYKLSIVNATYNAETCNITMTYSIDGTTKYFLPTSNTFPVGAIANTINLWIPSGITINLKNVKIQLEKGSVETDWEPYCGGTPSPNPSYPQEIRNIGVYDEESGKYAVEVKFEPKNLLTNYMKDGEKITVTATKDDYNAVYNDLYVDLEAGEQYIMSIKSDGTFGGINGEDSVEYFLLKDKSYANYFALTNMKDEKVFTVTVSGRYYLRLDVNKNGSTHSFWDIMVRKAEVTDRTYEPHREPTTATVYLDEPLRKGDKAYWNGGKMLVERNRAVEVFDGSDDERLAIQVDTLWYSQKELNTIPKDFSFLCDSYRNANVSDNVGNNAYINSSKWAVFYDSRFASASELRTWLQSNPVEFEYQLSEPITEEIDLSLDGLSMFYPTTVISNDCNANMEVTYIADTKAYIDKKFAELATAMV